MRFIPLLLCVALIIPVATTAGDGTTVTTTKEGSQETQDTETTDCGAPQQPDPFLDTFDLFDSFLPHFPLTFLDRATHSFGLDRDIFRQTRTYEPNSVTMKLEVPGLDSEDINVEMKSGGRVLSVSADKEIRDDEKQSFSSSHFRQSFTLDPGVETDKLTANLVDGVLTLHAPRHETLPPNRKIPITHIYQAERDEHL